MFIAFDRSDLLKTTYNILAAVCFRGLKTIKKLVIFKLSDLFA